MIINQLQKIFDFFLNQFGTYLSSLFRGLLDVTLNSGISQHLHTQQDGNLNQSAKMPLHSLLGSQARSLCSRYCCSHLQPSLQYICLCSYVHFSQCTYCSYGYRFNNAKTSPLVLFAHNGATTSCLTGHALLEQTKIIVL